MMRCIMRVRLRTSVSRTTRIKRHFRESIDEMKKNRSGLSQKIFQAKRLRLTLDFIGFEAAKKLIDFERNEG